MRKVNYAVCLFMFLLSGYVFWSSGRFPIEESTLGPAFFPELTAGLLVLFTGALLIQTVRDRNEPEDVAGPRSVFWVAICAMGAYLALMPRVGFFMATPVFLFCLGLYMAGDFKNWWKKLVLSSLITTGALYYLFAQMLNVPLP